MTSGCRNKILRINLSNGSITTEQPGEAFFRKYMGGKALAAYYLNKEVSGECDALSPENKLIVAPSVITGSPIAGTSRFTVAAKSPLSDAFGNSEAGGFWGPELKFAGYDAVIVEGKAAEPCYISINNDKIEIKKADHLWGKETGPVQDAIREEMGNKRVKVLQTGPAGEKMVRVAAISNNLNHWNGRCGLGAVFGSKNLRAIAVIGDNKEFMKEADKIKEYAKWFGSNMERAGLKEYGDSGTFSIVSILSNMGILPTKNFQFGEFEHADAIDGNLMKEQLRVKRESCFACPVRCKQVVKHESEDETRNVDPQYGGPEYESIGALGSNCGVADVIAVCKANEMVTRFGMDSIGTGMTIAFAMECFEKGIITKEDTGGIELTFGNHEALIQMIEQMAYRKGFGDVLAEGTYRAAQKIGNGAEKLAITSKKTEFAAHEPRGKWNVGLGYAVSPNGADHIVVEHDHCFMGEPNTDPDALGPGDLFPIFRYGIREPFEPMSLDGNKLRAFVVLQRLWSIMDTLDICIFVAEPSRRMITLEKLPELVSQITGWDVTLEELVAVSERGIVLSRLFNAKCGITSKDETLPERMFEPLGNGAIEGAKIPRDEFEEAKKFYYQMTGMDEEGAPLPGKLLEMKLEEFMA
ncbi:aldehyde ferredoxin oxidoreductase family protein [Labilibacter marinus]|uniref:aldehyde ferredoxin oxidoreductase family protein n=1 Tax=Labilibacter marinus TaxID=1477105 RepID=UPI00082CE8A5|nr:aldehyde ferredoxin oxidoreductase family protein [Labilibacter marinus]